MAVIFDQQQGQYVVNKPTLNNPKKPKLNYNWYNYIGIGTAAKNREYDAKVQAYKNALKEDETAMAQYESDLNYATQLNREDQIRKEVQEREDNAMQRWAEDARRAGVNVNLALGAQGAASGGGITNATGMDYGLQNNAMQLETQEALALLEQAFKGKENEKDRLNKFFSNIGLGALLKIK